MLYDLSQPIFNNVPQWPKHKPTSLTVPHFIPIEPANVERVELTTHTGTHIDAPFHFFPEKETVDDRRALSAEFLTARPYLTGEGASYFVSLGIHGVGIEGLSAGGYNDPEKETASHRVLLGNRKLIVEDIRVPDALLDGRVRHFAAFPILITGAGGAWARAIAWDQGDLY